MKKLIKELFEELNIDLKQYEDLTLPLPKSECPYFHPKFFIGLAGSNYFFADFPDEKISPVIEGPYKTGDIWKINETLRLYLGKFPNGKDLFYNLDGSSLDDSSAGLEHGFIDSEDMDAIFLGERLYPPLNLQEKSLVSQKALASFADNVIGNLKEIAKGEGFTTWVSFIEIMKEFVERAGVESKRWHEYFRPTVPK